MSRILTLRVKIMDEVQAKWIWESHMGIGKHHGVYVQAIAEGDLFERVDELEEMLPEDEDE